MFLKYVQVVANSLYGSKTVRHINKSVNRFNYCGSNIM